MSNIKVLYADSDNAATQAALQRLGQLGIEVTWATTAAEALTLQRKNSHQALVVGADLQGDMDSASFVERFYHEHKNAPVGVPIVFYADVDRSSALSVRNKGAWHWVRSSAGPDELAKRIYKLMKKNLPAELNPGSADRLSGHFENAREGKPGIAASIVAGLKAAGKRLIQPRA